MPLLSPKITKLGNATWFEINQGLNKAKFQIDDSHDSAHSKKKNHIYAVHRPKLKTSDFLINCLNLFGSQGGFDRMLYVLISKKSIDYKLLISLLKCFGKSYYIYHKDFIQKFAPNITDTVQSLIFK